MRSATRLSLIRMLIAASATVLFSAAGPLSFAQAEGTQGEQKAGDPPVAHGGLFYPASELPREIPYSTFLQRVEHGDVASVVISGDAIRGELKAGSRFRTVSPATDNRVLLDTLIRNKVEVTGERRTEDASSVNTLLVSLPVVLLVGVFLWFAREQQKKKTGGADVASFGKSRARAFNAGEVPITLGDVAGVDEAKQEVAELVGFLKDPDKFRRLGGKIPRGVLMVGPPGTGKTLLARAIAGEAGVPFFTLSGSDFVEMYVGVGASRVRDLFDQAEKCAPCIVFIDEIDAVGRHRGAPTGGSEEREQTLNQLLVRMDGFDGNRGVIVIAATNRPDVLDPALLRPGRFDRQVTVPLPDVRGREAIVRVHARHVPLAGDVDPARIARAVPGFSGADLANLVNEAALTAARADKGCVDREDFERAMEKIVMGAERRSLRLSEQDRRRTAYHEAGHALVGLNVPDHDPVYRVSIMPRGRALGATLYLPDTDRCSYTRTSLRSRICSLLGGRVAEALIFGPDEVTTGASNDIQRATEIAHAMVTQYGMCDQLGPLAYSGGVDTGSSSTAAQSTRFSNETARAIEEAVREIVETNRIRATQILEANIDALHRMADALVEHETLTGEQVQKIVQECRTAVQATLPDDVRLPCIQTENVT